MTADPALDSPDSPSTPGRKRALEAVAWALALLVLGYSLLVVQQFLVGFFAAAFVLALVYGALFLRRVARSYRRRTEALSRIATSLETMAEDGRSDHERTDSD